MEEEFKKILDEYSPQIFNFTARLCGRENAEDLTQETFIKVWKHFKRYDPEKSGIRTWIFSIARNTAIDFLRKKKALSLSLIEDFGESPKESFSLMISRLSADQKTVLSLHYEENMTFEEIGEVMKRPANTVKSLHRRAIESLRSYNP